MPYITVTQPAPVFDFESLDSFRKNLGRQGAVLLSLDKENVDHLYGPGYTVLDKLAEMGIGKYDTRIRPSTNNQAKASQSSNGRLESLAKLIEAEHIIVEEFRDVTEETCTASFHFDNSKRPGVPHCARPYHCRFVESTFLNKRETIERLRTILLEASVQNLTEAEKAAGTTRAIKIITWDAHLEEQTLVQAGLDLSSLGLDIEFWDIQLWYPFRARFHPQNPNSRGARTGGEKAFRSLGALDPTLTLHNGCNDAHAELVAFLRFMVMTKDEWTTWFDQRADLEPISYDSVDPGILEANRAMAPVPKPRLKGRRGRGNWGNKATSSRQAPGASNTVSTMAVDFLTRNVSTLNIEHDDSKPSTPELTSSSTSGSPNGTMNSDSNPTSPETDTIHISSNGRDEKVDHAQHDTQGDSWAAGEPGWNQFSVNQGTGTAWANAGGRDPWSRPKRRRNRGGRKRRVVEDDEYDSGGEVVWEL